MSKKQKIASVFSRIVGEELLSKGNKAFKTLHSKAATMAHDLAVSHLLHVAEHGNPSLLNEFFGILNTNERTAFGNYLRRIYAIAGGWDGTTEVSQEQMEDYKKRGKFMSFDKGTFKVLRNDDNEYAASAKAAVLNLGDELGAADGTRFKRFFDVNTLSEIKPFGIEQIADGLKKMLKKAKGEDSGFHSEVPANVIAQLQELATTIAPTTTTQVLQ